MRYHANELTEDEQRDIATTWNDEPGDYESNEVAINWNAALVYALAAFLP